MRIWWDGRSHDIEGSKVTLDPEGRRVMLTPDGTCLLELPEGLTRHWDPNLGLNRYRGREHLVTHATSFVQDATQFVAFLPAEPGFVRKPAFDGDSAFAPIDFAEEGLFAAARPMSLWGHERRAVPSTDLAGRRLATLPNREVFDLSSGEPVPYVPARRPAAGPHVRLDLQLGDSATLLTLFYAPRHLPGAQRFLRHLRDTEAAVRPIAAEATPFIRNSNVIFRHGREEFMACCATLEALVQRINASGYRSLARGSEPLPLQWPGVEQVNHALLNQLHFEFETFGDLFKASGGEERTRLAKIYGDFCQLNDTIHASEGAYENRDRGLAEAQFALHASLLPDFYENLTAEMYSEFTLDWDFGTLFMGYHTLGKDYLAAYWNDDLDLVRRNEVRPQRISSAEIFAYFGPGLRNERDRFRGWWEAHGLEAMGHSFDNPTNAFGYIPVADLDLVGVPPIEAKRQLKACTGLTAISTALL